jgi:hypothetical protein
MLFGELGKFADKLAAGQKSGRVVGKIDDDNPGPWGQQPLQLLEVQLPASGRVTLPFGYLGTDAPCHLPK